MFDEEMAVAEMQKERDMNTRMFCLQITQGVMYDGTGVAELLADAQLIYEWIHEGLTNGPTKAH